MAPQTLIRTFTNITDALVFVIIVHGEPCSSILAEDGVVCTYDDRIDAEECQDAFLEGTDIRDLVPGETLDLDMGW